MRGVGKPLFGLGDCWSAAENQGKDGAPTQGCLDCSRNWVCRQVALELGGAVRFSDLHLTFVGRWRRSQRDERHWRQGLRAGAVTLVAAMLLLSGIARSAAQDEPALTAAWLRQARVAGAKLSTDMNASAIERNLAALVQQNVSVVEADSNFSHFLNEQDFADEINLMRQYVKAAHRLGLKVVWYVATLEILSEKTGSSQKTMSGLHPDWLQHGIDGTPNVFVGRAPGTLGSVHWVDPGTESAWMSIHSPYADVFTDRIKQIAATGVDGIWLDVPLFSELGAAWPDAGPGAAAKFQADTGLQVPRRVDWDDPTWRRWIAWRYQEISSFLLRVRDAARSVSNDVSIIVETVSLDYGLATLVGLDGSILKDAANIIQAWEVDAVSDQTAMREAQPDDWISLIGMAKFAKAASGRKPSWMFVYGDRPDDSLLVMAEALAAGNNPFETKTPKMTTTAGVAYRRQIYGWVKQEERRLFESRSAAKVAVYFSPESRDYLDKAKGTGLYTVPRKDDVLWWSNLPNDSLYLQTYLAEYRGIIKWLVHNHVPFDIVVRPRAEELSRYDAVIAPALAALSDQAAELLDRYVERGGHLVVTGPDPGTLDEFGNARAAPILGSLDGRERPRQVDAPATPAPRGTALHSPQWLGKSYLTSTSPDASGAIGALLGTRRQHFLETDANANVHIEVRTLGDETLVHLINPERLWNKQAPEQREVGVSLALRPGVAVKDVRVTVPGPAARIPQGATRLPFNMSGNRVVFRVPVKAYSMVIVSTQP